MSTKLVEEDLSTAERDVLVALHRVEDLHIPVSVVDMGMIYDIEVDGSTVHVDMTFPCMGCPAYGMMQRDIESAVDELDWVETVEIEVVWDPVWSKDDLTSEARRKLKQSGVEI